MSNPLLLDIVTFLITKSIIIGDGIDSFRDFVPEKPDNIAVLFEYSGSAGLAYDDGVHRSIQVITRNLSADAARQKALDIYSSLKDAQSTDGKIQFTATRWGQVYLRQSPFFLKQDENNRTLYVFNIGITTTIE